MAANTGDLGRLVAEAIADPMAGYGLTVPELYIENSSLPPAVAEALDKRTSAGLVGDAGTLPRHLAANTATGAAEARPPQPPPMEHVWHIAEAGQTHGPYSRAAMGRMARQGHLSRDSFVWTPGQDGWMRAEDVTELAQLLTVLPPTPPDP